MTEPTTTTTVTAVATPNPEPTQTGPTFTDEQQKVIDGRIAAARRQAEADAKKRIEAEAEERRKAEETDRERKAAAERGEFDTVRASLETERDTIKGERDALTERIGKYDAALKPVIEGQLKTLQEIDKDAAAGFPAEADALVQLDWLNDPRTQRLMQSAADKRTALDRNRLPGTPPVNGGGRINEDEARRSQARMYRDF